ncbi:MAG: hypothetical protein ACT4PJ_06830 [Gemmatimonadaceae bacterium]
MSFSLRRWRPRHLLLAWGVYWIALIVVGLAMRPHGVDSRVVSSSAGR